MAKAVPYGKNRTTYKIPRLSARLRRAEDYERDLLEREKEQKKKAKKENTPTSGRRVRLRTCAEFEQDTLEFEKYREEAQERHDESLEEEMRLKASMTPTQRKMQSSLPDTLQSDEYISNWLKALEYGTLNGEFYSETTRSSYEHYVQAFLKRHHTLSMETLEKALLEIPVGQYAKRDKLFKALVCFAKYMIKTKHLELSFLDEVKTIKPKQPELRIS